MKGIPGLVAQMTAENDQRFGVSPLQSALSNDAQPQFDSTLNSVQELTSLYDSAAERVRQQRVGPSKSDFFFALSAALGAPTKTGSRGETMANVSEALGKYSQAQREAQAQQKAELDKLEFTKQAEILKRKYAIQEAREKALREAQKLTPRSQYGMVDRFGNVVVPPVESQNKVGVPSPNEFTTESIQKFIETGNYNDLERVNKEGKTSPGQIFALPDGSIVQSVFENGKYYYDTESGRKPVPAGARPTTAGVAAPLPQKQFIDYQLQIQEDENALNQLNNYFNTVKDMNVGYSRLADQISANAKNFFAASLSPQELATQIGKGQVQGLIGLFRTDIAGPGVVTDSDAQRIMSALGGDPSKLQNPQVTEALLRNLFNEKRAKVDFLKRELSRSNPFYGVTGSAPSPEFGVTQRPQPSAPSRGFGAAVKE